MLKSAALALLSVVIAVVGGAASVWHVVGARDRVGVVAVDGWTTLPDRGLPGSNPYAHAQLARGGALPLGQAEGLAFTADRDAQGQPLLRECRYRLAGTLPPARLWTLHSDDPGSAAVGDKAMREGTLNSQIVLYDRDGAFEVEVSSRAVSGNWLAVEGTGPMLLTLTLYDTPLAGNADFADVSLLRITRVDCG